MFSEGIAYVRDEKLKWSLINKNFRRITKRTYDMIYGFYNGYASVELNGLFRFINKVGEEICEIKYKTEGCFEEKGFAQISLTDKKFDRVFLFFCL